MIGLKRGVVRLEDHNPKWQELYLKEKELLINTFGDKILAIEHIGSTAIPHLPAKPIIDINAAVETFGDFYLFIKRLPELGYEFIPERMFADRKFFPKGPPQKRTHHLNIVEISSRNGWLKPLLFRDYLRIHEEARKEYGELKRVLETRYVSNRKIYTEQKENFILKVLEQARKEINLVSDQCNTEHNNIDD